MTLIAGLLSLIPQSGFQVALSQGDHGRDLYAAERSLHGDVPYQDYWWVYGPLMPYYYGALMKFFGTSIATAVAGKLALTFASGILIYLGLSLWVAPAWALMGSLWFWNFYEDFFFTYNHTGGTLLLLAILWGLFHYIKHRKCVPLFWALLAAVTLSFMKINIGFFALLGLVISVAITDYVLKTPLKSDKKIFYFLSCMIAPFLVLLTYAALLQGLTIAEIRQCLPYMREDHPYNTSMFQSLKFYLEIVWANIRSGWVNTFFALLIVLSGVQLIAFSFKRDTDRAFLKQLWLVLGTTAFFFVLMTHEFMASSVLYRMSWARPFQFILLFIILAAGTSRLTRSIQILLYLGIFWIVSTQLISRYEFIQNSKIPERSLELQKSGVYLGNTFEWIQTVEQTTQYLQETLDEEELFFALPYDPLYYFLTGKQGPTRQLIFFDHINIPADQEKKIIAELEEKNVNYVLVSNRINSTETGLGYFGKTYCVLISKYLEENFEETARFGNWTGPAGWRDYHGVKILKRRAGRQSR
jgi:hypothetical protein